MVTPASAIQWQFRKDNEHWTWCRLLVDGGIDTVSAKGFSEYAQAVDDAMRHGFSPRRDYWVIVTRRGVTHYRSGERPAFIPAKDVERPLSLQPRYISDEKKSDAEQ